MFGRPGQLSQGFSPAEIARSHPFVSIASVRAEFAYTAGLAGGHVVAVPTF